MNWNSPSAEEVAALLSAMKLELLVGERHHVGRIDAGRVGGAQDRLDEPARDAHTAEAQQLIGIAVARESAGAEGRLLLARRAVVAGRELGRKSERRLMDRREVEGQARLGRGRDSRRAGAVRRRRADGAAGRRDRQERAEAERHGKSRQAVGCAPPARRPQGEGPPGLEPAHPVRARRNGREAGVRRRRPAMIHEAPNPRAVFAGASRLLVRCGAGFWGAVMTRIGQRNRKGSGAGEDFLLRWSGRNRYAEAILEKSGVARRQDFAPFLLD